uniref:Uncharacterized protein n=1 Tax=Arundo donax TaxID=35708 RepID=A0A0A9D9K5_ARUDO
MHLTCKRVCIKSRLFNTGVDIQGDKINHCLIWVVKLTLTICEHKKLTTTITKPLVPNKLGVD